MVLQFHRKTCNPHEASLVELPVKPHCTPMEQVWPWQSAIASFLCVGNHLDDLEVKLLHTVTILGLDFVCTDKLCNVLVFGRSPVSKTGQCNLKKSIIAKLHNTYYGVSLTLIFEYTIPINTLHLKLCNFVCKYPYIKTCTSMPKPVTMSICKVANFYIFAACCGL